MVAIREENLIHVALIAFALEKPFRCTAHCVSFSYHGPSFNSAYSTRLVLVLHGWILRATKSPLF